MLLLLLLFLLLRAALTVLNVVCRVCQYTRTAAAFQCTMQALHQCVCAVQALDHEQKPLAFQLVMSLVMVLGYVIALLIVQKTVGPIKVKYPLYPHFLLSFTSGH